MFRKHSRERAYVAYSEASYSRHFPPLILCLVFERPNSVHRKHFAEGQSVYDVALK